MTGSLPSMSLFAFIGCLPLSFFISPPRPLLLPPCFLMSRWHTQARSVFLSTSVYFYLSLLRAILPSFWVLTHQSHCTIVTSSLSFSLTTCFHILSLCLVISCLIHCSNLLPAIPPSLPPANHIYREMSPELSFTAVLPSFFHFYSKSWPRDSSMYICPSTRTQPSSQARPLPPAHASHTRTESAGSFLAQWREAAVSIFSSWRATRRCARKWIVAHGGCRGEGGCRPRGYKCQDTASGSSDRARTAGGLSGDRGLSRWF